ncbi:hypothetical protein AXW83_06370 [Bosea sp. PAMC 26642]|nr:hypothetical protein AXW83_06370 [Bosea sp. PAMC 26642]
MQLWQAADQMERRKDGEYQRRAGKAPRVAVHIDAALPYGLTTQQAQAATETFAAALVGRFGVFAQWAVHHKEGSANDHMHILMSTRRFAETDFGRKVRALDGIAARKKELAEGNPLIVETRNGTRQISGEMEWMRSTWADLISQFTLERVDHRSFARQGIPDEPVTILRRGEIEYQKRLERRGIPHISWRQTRSVELEAREVTSWGSPLLASTSNLSASDRSRSRRNRLRQLHRDELTPMQGEVVAASTTHQHDVLLGASSDVDLSIVTASSASVPNASLSTRSRNAKRRRARMRQSGIERLTARLDDAPLLVLPPQRNRSDRLVSDQTSARRARLRLQNAAAMVAVAAPDKRTRQFRDDCIKALKKRGRAILLAKISKDGRRAGDLEPSRLRTAMQHAIEAQIEDAKGSLGNDTRIIDLFRQAERERQRLIVDLHRAAGVLAHLGKRGRRATLEAFRIFRTLEGRRLALDLRHDDEAKNLMVQTINQLGELPTWAQVSRSVPAIQPDAHFLYPVSVVDNAAPTRNAGPTSAPAASRRSEFEEVLGETAYRMHIHNKLTGPRMVAMSAAASINANDLAKAAQRWADRGSAPRSWGDLTEALSKFGREGRLVSQIVASVQVIHQHPTKPFAKSENATAPKSATKLPEI